MTTQMVLLVGVVLSCTIISFAKGEHSIKTNQAWNIDTIQQLNG